MDSIEPKLFIRKDNELFKLPFELQEHRTNLDECYLRREANLWMIDAFQSLKLAMQPVIETMILLDRSEYLKEQGFDVELKPIFDENISPRNMAIVATVRHMPDL